MTRLIWLTFYGNARYETRPGSESTPIIPVVSGGSGEADTEERQSAVEGDPDNDPSPTVSYGDPVATPVGHEPHESPPIMTFPIMVLAVLAAVGGIINLPFTSMEWLDKWLESSFRGVPEVHPDSFVGGLGLELLTFAVAAGGIFLGYTLYKKGLEHADRDPLDEKLGRVAPILGHAYYYDAGVAWLVGGPGRALASWLDRVVDNKIIDGTVNAVGGFFMLLSRGVQQMQDGRVRRYALAIAIGVVGVLLYVVIWLGR
jgi:NADH-quinone oxidoreductase subunit L